MTITPGTLIVGGLAGAAAFLIFMYLGGFAFAKGLARSLRGSSKNRTKPWEDSNGQIDQQE